MEICVYIYTFAYMWESIIHRQLSNRDGSRDFDTILQYSFNYILSNI